LRCRFVRRTRSGPSLLARIYVAVFIAVTEQAPAMEKLKEEAKMKKLEEEATVHDGKHDH
jgi:hypothetical protein